MRSKICWLTIFFVFCAVAPECHGQGLFQRLRNRIRQNIDAQTQSQTPTANTLPARPIPMTRDGASEGPTSNYRNGVVPIPSEAGSPNPADDPRVVEQAGAESEGLRSRLRSGFGGSILAGPGAFDRDAETARPSIGIQGINANPGYPGVQVRSFAASSKADEAGLKEGDYIFAVDGVATPNTKALVEAVSRYKVGDTIRLRIGRDGGVSDIEIPLVDATATSARRPATQTSSAPNVVHSAFAERAPQQVSTLGAEFEDATGTRGARVVVVQPNSPASAAGLQPEDRVVSVNNRLVANAESLSAFTSKLRSDAPLQLRVVRGQQLLQLDVDLNAPQQPTPASGTPTLAPPAQEPPKEPGSMFGGLSSALGGVFGGGDSVGEDASEVADELALPEPTKEPVTDPGDEAVKDEIAELKERLKELEAKLEK